MEDRFFFSQDDSCHWYMIPEKWKEEWYKLIEDEECWDKPEWGKFEKCRTGGGISNISFTDPK